MKTLTFTIKVQLSEELEGKGKIEAVADEIAENAAYAIKREAEENGITPEDSEATAVEVEVFSDQLGTYHREEI